MIERKPAQLQILKVLLDLGGKSTIRSLSHALEKSPQTLSPQVKALVNEGVVVKVPHSGRTPAQVQLVDFERARAILRRRGLHVKGIVGRVIGHLNEEGVRAVESEVFDFEVGDQAFSLHVMGAHMNVHDVLYVAVGKLLVTHAESLWVIIVRGPGRPNVNRKDVLEFVGVVKHRLGVNLKVLEIPIRTNYADEERLSKSLANVIKRRL